MAADLIEGYFPDGRFYNFDDSRDLSKIMTALNDEVLRVKDFFEARRDEISIGNVINSLIASQGMFGTLSDWETRLGIPDETFHGNLILSTDEGNMRLSYLERARDVLTKLLLIRLDNANKDIILGSTVDSLEWKGNVFSTIGHFYGVEVEIDPVEKKNDYTLIIKIAGFGELTDPGFPAREDAGGIQEPGYRFTITFGGVRLRLIQKLQNIFLIIRPAYMVFEFRDI